MPDETPSTVVGGVKGGAWKRGYRLRSSSRPIS